MRSRMRLPAGWWKVVAVAAATSVVIAPTAVWASHQFTDVPDTNIFHDDIDWLKDAGVTIGCNPPANTEFCPSDNVTREQMAAFMRRLAQYLDAEDGTPAVADHATTADDADTLDGLDSTDFVAAGIVVRTAEATVADGSSASAQAACEEGEVLIGGGGAISAFVDDVPLLSSRPSLSNGDIPPDGSPMEVWRASAINTAGGTGDVMVRAHALCASISALATAAADAVGAEGP